MATGRTWISEFPGNFVWSNAALVTKGMAPYGAVALGEIDEVCERLRGRQAEPEAWQAEWCALGRRLEAVAAKAAAAGHELTAGNYYLRAGMYYFTGERPWVMGVADMDTAIDRARLFSLAGVADRVACPFLIVHAEDDRVVPVESARRLYAALGSPRKQLRILTAADGGTYHAQADNRQVGIDYVADWLEETL
jgi:pimeloyl-ACP methyl ester carboxylesterase